MGHGHHHHAPASGRRLWIALALILGLMAAEVAVAIVADSLALLSDAAHMLSDAAAIALSLIALRLAARPPRGALTYGYGRAEEMSALVNGMTLLLLGMLLVVEGVRRLFDPPDVDGGLVLAVALVAIPVNLAAVRVLAGAERESMSVEGAFQHVLTDLYAFIGTAAAGAVILAGGPSEADPVAALLVAALMLRSAWGLLRAAGRVFLEAAPAGLDPDEIGHALASVPRVREVHDLHVWELTRGRPALSAHVLVAPDEDCHAVRRELQFVLRERFGLAHTTLQVDHEREHDHDLIELEDRR